MGEGGALYKRADVCICVRCPHKEKSDPPLMDSVGNYH